MKPTFKLKNYKIKKYDERDFNKVADLICKFQKKAKLSDLSSLEDQISSRLKRMEIEWFLDQYNTSDYTKYVGVNTDTNQIYVFSIFHRGTKRHSLVFTAKHPDCALTSTALKSFKEMINLFCKNHNTKELYSPLTKRENYEKYVNFMIKVFKAERVKTEKHLILIKYKIPLDI